MSKIRIFQFTPTLKRGDGVGNDVLAIHNFLRKEKNINTCIYYEFCAEKFDSNMAKNITRNKVPSTDEDILLIHVSIEWKYNEYICSLPGRKIFIYHNITPPKFFEEYNNIAYNASARGIEQVKKLKDAPEYCLAVSQFNKDDLISYGYKCPIDILPIIIPFDDYRQSPDEETLKHYDDGKTNILFVGRIAPNKKQEDVILAFHYYQKYYNPDSRLILLGSYDKGDRYYNKLVSFVEELGVKDVAFTCHLPFKQVIATFKSADLFVCMSEHEGFCIPLIEAMFFEIPIIAYDSTAIKDTLGNGGILMSEKNPLEVAGMMNYLMNHKEIIDTLRENQKKILADMEYEKIAGRLWDYLTKFEPGLNEK